MADFYQNGIITTLHNLDDRPIEEVEAQLNEFANKRPMALILPSLYSELQGEALPHIIKELTQVPYLNQIVIGLDRATRSEFAHAAEFLGNFHNIIGYCGMTAPVYKRLTENSKL